MQRQLPRAVLSCTPRFQTLEWMLTMKAILFCTVLAFALSARQAPAVPAQTQPPQPPAANEQEEQTKITLDVTRVNILFTVTDKKGRFVTDLGQNDFSIVENKKPQVISQFTAE